MEIVQEMQSYYGKRAPVYDRSMGYDDPQTVCALEPVIGHLKSLLGGRRILEVACGPCFWTHAVQEVAASIRATDYNQTTLDQARHKDLDWDKVALQRADAYDLSLVPGCFDAAFAVDWFAHVPKARLHGFLQGLHGRLEPGALVAFCDQLPGPDSLSGTYDAEGNHMQTRELPDGTQCRVIKHFFGERELRELLSSYSDQIRIERFPECRRAVVSYLVGSQR